MNATGEFVKGISDGQSSRSYRPDIDGIRAIAILSVVIYHANEHSLPGGFTGVDIFFIISGYLIGGHIYSEIRSGTFSFLNFYKRRAKRILPAFYLVLSLVFVASVVLLTPVEIKVLAMSAISSLLSASNYYFYRRLGDYFVTTASFNPLLMTWSLGVEEQFYALAPLTMVLFARVRRSLLLPAVMTFSILSFTLAVLQLGKYPNYVFYLLPTRAWELGAGVTLALSELDWCNRLSKQSAQIVGILGLVLMVVPMFTLTPSTPFPGVSALPSVLGTGLVISTSASWMNATILGSMPLVFLGRISYSWYLFHYPVLIYMGALSGREMSPPVTALAVLISIVCAVLSYYLVEQPFRKSTRPSKPLLIRYFGVTIAFMLAFTFLRYSSWTLSGYPHVSQHDEGLSGGCEVDYGVDEPNLSKACYDTSDPLPTVALWGDSHAGVLAPVFREVANNQGYKFVQMVKSSCLPIIGSAIRINNYPNEARNCMHFNNEVLRLVLSEGHVRIVILTGEWSRPFSGGDKAGLLILDQASRKLPSASAGSREVFYDSLASAIRPLRDAGIHVILVDDSPIYAFDPQLRYETSIIPARHGLASFLGEYRDDSGLATPDPTPAADTATELMKNVKIEFPVVDLVELKSVFCEEQNYCAYIANGKLLYRDPGHLTLDGAKYALRRFSLPSL